MFMCIGACKHVDNLRHHVVRQSRFSHGFFFFLDCVSYWPRTNWTEWASWPASLTDASISVSSPSTSIIGHSVLCFPHGFWGSNSHPCACRASALLTEPSPLSIQHSPKPCVTITSTRQLWLQVLGDVKVFFPPWPALCPLNPDTIGAKNSALNIPTASFPLLASSQSLEWDVHRSPPWGIANVTIMFWTAHRVWSTSGVRSQKVLVM